MKNSIIVISARAISGLSGYVILAIAANLLTASQFAELTLVQTVIFLFLIFFDAGLIQLATRETAGSENWKHLADQFQGIRYTIHIVSTLLLILLSVFGFIQTQDPWLPTTAAIALLTNSLVLDWILFCRQEQRLWAKKILITALTNFAVTATFLALFKQPSSVLVGTSVMNALGWLYLYKKQLTTLPKPILPTARNVRTSAQFSFSAILFHSAYNTPLLVATSWAGGMTAGAFSVLYRLFSASTMFVPTLIDFAVAREVSKLKTGSAAAYAKIFARLFFISLSLSLPIIVIPTEYLHSVFSLAIDLAKFQISPSDFNVLKAALILFSFDFCCQRTAYVLDHRRLLIVSSIAGLLASAVVFGLMLSSIVATTMQAWFYPLFAYQTTTTTLILLYLLRHAATLQTE